VAWLTHLIYNGRFLCLYAPLQVIKAVRKEILQGCKIVFSRVFPNNTRPQEQMFWKMAEYLGAICSTDVDSSVTHVVTVDLGTEKARWGVDNKQPVRLFVYDRGL